MGPTEQSEIEQLRRRIEELERRPVHYPAYFPFWPPQPVYYPPVVYPPTWTIAPYGFTS